MKTDKVRTPHLTMANDEDDTVPWQQGIQFFTAMGVPYLERGKRDVTPLFRKSTDGR